MDFSGILVLMGDSLYKRRYQNASICLAKHHTVRDENTDSLVSHGFTETLCKPINAFDRVSTIFYVK